MAVRRMRGAALAAALAVITGERPRDCPRAPAVLTGPSRHGPEPGRRRPAAERAAGWRRPALVRAGRGRRNDSLAIGGRADAAGNPATHAPSAGRRGCPCVLSGLELSDR